MTHITTNDVKFSKQEVHQALLDLLKSKNPPRPDYIGDTASVTYKWDDDGIRVIWTKNNDEQA